MKPFPLAEKPNEEKSLITEQQKAETELIQSEEKYRTLMENLNEVIMMVDNDDKILFVNKKFTEKLGYTYEEIIGRIGYQTLVSKENQNIIKENNLKRIRKETSQYEMTFIASDGTAIDFLVNGAPIVDSTGKTIGSLGAMIDITDRKNAEKALKESEEKFRLLAENVPGAIYLCKFDNDRSILFLNDEIEKITGYSKNDFFSKSVSLPELCHPDDSERVKTMIEKSFKAKKAFHQQYRIKHRNDYWIWLEEFGVGIERNGEIELIEGFIIDITDKKKAELELQEYRDNLEKLVKQRTQELAIKNEELNVSNYDLTIQHQALEKALENLKTTQKQLIQSEKMASLGILSAGVAHEINNPLNFIYNGTASIEKYITEKYPSEIKDLRQLFDAVNTGVSRITGIVRSMNRYCWEENLPLSICKIQDVIDNCLILLNDKFDKRIKVRKNYIHDSPSLLANEGRLHQAFLNILANCAQAIEKEGVVTIDVTHAGGLLKISITDNGTGISSENLHRVFDPFFTTKDPGSGIGLGLAITKKIIHENQGTIWCDSVLGEGTTFYVTFPLNNN